MNNETQTVNSRTVDIFNRTFTDRYEIGQPLGSGQFGSTYLAFDKRRRLEVCIKIYHQTGQLRLERDWYITSVLKCDYLADTFAIETFKDDCDDLRTAAVSRFIPGVTLDQFLRKYEEQSFEVQRNQRHIILRDIGLELCNAVVFCAEQGHSHGDLHERNVIVTHPIPSTRSRFGIVLVDFDNKSSGSSSIDENASSQDVFALRRLLLRMVHGARHSSEAERILRVAEDCSFLSICFRQCLKLFGDSLDKDFGSSRVAMDWNYLVRQIALCRTMGMSGMRLANAIHDEFIMIARSTGTEEQFNHELKEMESHLSSDPGNILDYNAGQVAISQTPSWMGRLLQESPQRSSPARPGRGTLFSVGINKATLKNR